MVNQEILNSNVSIEEEIYNFEKGLKDDGNDWTGFPQIDLKEDSQCIYICGNTEYDWLFLNGVQFLGEADQRVQEYWMQRFKESKKRNKLFIVYSDCLPEDLKNMPESVVEFFESGIVVQLKSSKG